MNRDEHERRIFEAAQWDGDSPYTYVLSLNLHRRHLTDDQRATIGAEALPMIESETEARRREKISEARSGDAEIRLNSTGSDDPTDGHASRKQAAEQFQVSTDRIRRAKALKATDQEAFEEVKTGKTMLKDAEKKVRQSKRPERIVHAADDPVLEQMADVARQAWATFLDENETP